MNLETPYLGLRLRNPLVVGSAPFCDQVDVAVQMQDAGAAAVVMRSLFAEQIEPPRKPKKGHRAGSAEGPKTDFPEIAEYQLSPDQYLRQVERLKSALSIPVITSLNGSHPGHWTDFAPRLKSAGADAIELNCYRIVTDPAVPAEEAETVITELLRHIITCVRIPVAVKISPYHSSVAQLAESLDIAGAAGVVIFNRFYQPDVNIRDLTMLSKLQLSDSSELLLRLRWLAILSPILRGSLAVTGGVHTVEDVVKSLLCGADVTQVVSAIARRGATVLTEMLSGLEGWMREHQYDSVDSFRGLLDLRHSKDASAIERANYLRVLQSYRVKPS